MQPPETQSNIHTPGQSRIVLIGASVRAAAQSARRGGYRVIGIDLFGDTDTRDLCDEFHQWSSDDTAQNDEILRGVGNLPIVQVGGLRLSTDQIRRVIGSQRTESNWRSFDDLGEFANSPTIGFPATRSFSSMQPDPSPPPIGGRWLRKQIDGCGGLGVRWANHEDPTADVHLQRWVPGRPHGASLIHDGQRAHLLGICRSYVHRIDDLPFVYAGSIGPLRLSSKTEAALIQFADRLATTRQLRGLLNIDFVLDSNDRAWILEVNPRWSASMELIERRLNESEPEVSLIADSLRACQRTLTPTEVQTLSPCRGHRYCKRIHFADRPLVFSRSEWKAQLLPGQTLHDIPQDGQPIDAGQPICTVIEDLDHNQVP